MTVLLVVEHLRFINGTEKHSNAGRVARTNDFGAIFRGDSR